MADAHAFLAFRALGALFVELPPTWARSRLIELHRSRRPEITALFERERGLAELVRRNPEQLYAICWDDSDILDPLNLRNVSSLLAVLLDEYVGAFPVAERADVIAELEHTLGATTASLTRTVEGEVRALGELFQNILDVLNALPGLKQFGRLILPELPVGNSIPCKLLEPVLVRAGYTVVTTRVALSRNDARSKGMRRADLLAEKLEAVGLKPNDVVLYLDEWFSGVNYARLCESIQKILAKHPGVHFLPAAMVKLGRAKLEPRYDRFVADHHARASGVTSCSDRLRMSVPPTKSKFVLDPEFFWSEHDRTSGYRKMQLLGAIYSSLDAGVEELHKDPHALFEARELCLEYLGDRGVEVPEDVARDPSLWVEFFEEGYADYATRRDGIAKLEHLSNLGECETFEFAVEDVVSGIVHLVKGTPAERCMTIAAFYARRRSRPEIDPEDRYFFRTHAPIIGDLSPGARRYHEHFMEHLTRRVDQHLEV